MKIDEKKRLIEKLQQEVTEAESPKMTKADEKKLNKLVEVIASYDYGSGLVVDTIYIPKHQLMLEVCVYWEGEEYCETSSIGFDDSNFSDFEKILWEHCQGCDEWKVFDNILYDDSEVTQKHYQIIQETITEFEKLQKKYPHLDKNKDLFNE